ncbi:hypothetical protein TSUD_215230 [Trifolium subterraneum]|uniref:NB-ARC domain-containing protein n=1 Tax=Trifolium subterraneum TaxID=3900 RepID=A0A2Z6N4D7_TRISU|nr:hypothetical protein TSUD_215230 [Trifolium subterraneum]
MAEVGVLLDNLRSRLQNEFSTISGISSNARKLSTTLDLIKAVLEDAEMKQLTDLSIKVWIQQLKDAVYVLDDILDECSIKSNRLKGSSFFNPKNIMFRHDIGNRLKDITRRFDDIAESRNNFLLQEGVTMMESSSEVAEWRQTSSFIAEHKVYGREDDKEKIVEFLLNQAWDSNSLQVYPIVGLGGVGKTTLAQLLYNDRRVSTNFDTKIWVCVSEVFSVKRILCSIIESIERQKCDAFDLVIQNKVQELLHGKRFLLVLDDVWHKNEELKFGLSQEKWNQLKSVLCSGSKGSSCLVSTRDDVVASIMGTCQAHHLSGLSENECWLLFKQYAFGHDREEQVELVEIGKEIAKKCGGLPLAAQALGGLMRSRSGVEDWLEIKESRLWDSQSENFILSALRLSYSYLTPTLKQCFTFCAMFPKDTEILKEELIHLWMANGFIFPEANLEIEYVGDMIWNELCQKSFFQDIKIDDYSGDTTFKMNNLVHDLAQSIMGRECMILENTNTNLSRNTHHISFDPTNMLPLNEDALKKVDSLRTLYQLKFPNKLFGLIPNSHSLRVLCAKHFQLSSLKSFIHLRYLELHDHDIEILPDSIYSLQKLEILKLKHFSELRCLPEHLTRLGNLRHLVIEDCYSLSHMFPYVGKLSSLRTLSVYIVELKRGHSLAELNDLNLGGKLSIEGLENVANVYEAQEANLMGKTCLSELCLSWSKKGETETRATSYEQVLEMLQPHSNLKRLKICDYEGSCFPSWLGILSSLVSLELQYCKSCASLSPIGKLPYLKKLHLLHLDEVQYLDDEYDNGLEVRAFPSLEELSLEKLFNIEKLLKVERGGMFPRLSNLTFLDCPKLELPFLPSVKDLFVVGCNNEILRSISGFYGLNTLYLGAGIGAGKVITSFPGMLRNLSYLKDLTVADFPKLKELPNEPFNLALEHLHISCCAELESLPERIWEGLRSLRTMEITGCKELRSLPEGIRHLTSLEVLTIYGCPALEGRLMERTGEDWDKIAHIPKLDIR